MAIRWPSSIVCVVRASKHQKPGQSRMPLRLHRDGWVADFVTVPDYVAGQRTSRRTLERIISSLDRLAPSLRSSACFPRKQRGSIDKTSLVRLERMPSPMGFKQSLCTYVMNTSYVEVALHHDKTRVFMRKTKNKPETRHHSNRQSPLAPLL